MEENKVKLCAMFLKVLQETEAFSDLKDLQYTRLNSWEETVTAVFEGGYKYAVNVSMDSGAAMLHDILRQLRG